MALLSDKIIEAKSPSEKAALLIQSHELLRALGDITSPETYEKLAAELREAALDRSRKAIESSLEPDTTLTTEDRLSLIEARLEPIASYAARGEAGLSREMLFMRYRNAVTAAADCLTILDSIKDG